MSPNKLVSPGEVDIKTIELRMFNGSTVDLRPYLVSCEIVEDIYSNTMSGAVILNEGLNLVETFRIGGFENVYVQWKTAGHTNYNNVTLRVYRVGKPDNTSEGSSIYTLWLVAPELIQSTANPVNRAFKSNITDVIRVIHKEFLKSDMQLECEQTLNALPFIACNWTGLYTINWLTQRARPKANPNACNYLFWQSIDGFRFMSLDSLYQQDPRATYTAFSHPTRDPENPGRNVRREFFNADRIDLASSPDMIQWLKNGSMANSCLVTDLVTKRWFTSTYSLADGFQELNHMNPNPPYPIQTNDLLGYPAANYRHIPHASYRFPGIPEPDKPEFWALRRDIQMNLGRYDVVQGVYPGDSTIRVGQVANLLIPSVSAMRPDKQNWINQRVSGNYLVSCVKHVFNVQECRMDVEFVKESTTNVNPDRIDGRL
jgi:hypothetical protein